MNGLIVVVPLYNEAGLVATFLERLRQIEPELPLHGLVVVDDGSIDDTVAIVEREAPTCPFPIRLIRLSRNFGHQNAIIAGLQVAHTWAESAGVPWIGVIDGDLQDRPEHFKDLLGHAEGYDVVFAERSSRAEGPLVRWLASAFYRILSASAKLNIPPNVGAFSILRTPIANIIFQNSDADPYFPGLRAWVGFRQGGVPLPRDARLSGTSKVGRWGLFVLSLRALFTYTDLLFNVVLVSGGIIVALTCTVSVVLFWMRLAGLITIPGATTTVMLILLSLGTTIFFLGIIAHMIRRANESASRQRAFIVMESLNLE